MKTVYLICGVAGSGKTWVSKQMSDKFSYVPHDEHYNDILAAINKASLKSDKPIITECPFGERSLRQELEGAGYKVIPIFVVENPFVCFQRYLKREGKPPSKAMQTRATTIMTRAHEWSAFSGTSQEVLDHLKHLSQGWPG